MNMKTKTHSIKPHWHADMIEDPPRRNLEHDELTLEWQLGYQTPHLGSLLYTDYLEKAAHRISWDQTPGVQKVRRDKDQTETVQEGSVTFYY